MSSNEKFCLRWNDFETNVSSAFRELREEKDFFDCTLSCGTRQLQAHKLILSACSPFFKEILKLNPHQHPLLYLKGVNFNDLMAVLNFMYHGEVNIAQEELNSFLAAAEDLQVKGLTQNENSQVKTKPPDTKLYSAKTQKDVQPQVSTKVCRPTTSYSRGQTVESSIQDDVQEVLPVIKSEPVTNINTYPELETETEPIQNIKAVSQVEIPDQHQLQSYDEDYRYGTEEYEYGEYDGTVDYQQEPSDLDTSKGSELNSSNIESYISEGPSGYTCQLCGKCLGKFKQSCKRHIKLVHMNIGTKLQCGNCDLLFKNRESLKTHERLKHNIYATTY